MRTTPKTPRALAPLLSALLLSCVASEEASATSGWLRTVGNRIYDEDGRVWAGVGANLHDTRSCNACTSGPPNVGEVKRRIDELVDVWGASFIRLDLESYGSSSVLRDASYLNDVIEIVDHIGTKDGVYVLLSLWIDPSFSDLGWPTAATRDVWRRLAETFADYPYVMYGLVNEPQHNYDGAQNQAAWNAMNDTVAAIRDVEDSLGSPRHLIAVQGLGGWARFLDYYIDHPISAGEGENIVYETHVYDPQSRFRDLFERPSETLPVVVGEYGPIAGMSMNDVAVLQERAHALGIPTLAWTFHMRCPPNLIIDYSNGGCGVGMPLEPTAWGLLLREHLDRVNAEPPRPPTIPPVQQPEPEPEPEPEPGTGPVLVPPVTATPTEDLVERGEQATPDPNWTPGFRFDRKSSPGRPLLHADADEVRAEIQGGPVFTFEPSRGGWVSSQRPIPRGTTMRLEAIKAGQRERTGWFRYLVDPPR